MVEKKPQQEKPKKNMVPLIIIISLLPVIALIIILIGGMSLTVFDSASKTIEEEMTRRELEKEINNNYKPDVVLDDALSTVIKTVNLGQRETQKGYSVIIDKIEFTEDETRVYISLENNGLYNFTIYEEYSVITQGNNQYKAIYNLSGYTDSEGNLYESVRDPLEPNSESKDFLLFPAIELKSFKLEVDGTSSKFGEDVELFNFDIEV